jgi:hypothetical protein
MKSTYWRCIFGHDPVYRGGKRFFSGGWLESPWRCRRCPATFEGVRFPDPPPGWNPRPPRVNVPPVNEDR